MFPCTCFYLTFPPHLQDNGAFNKHPTSDWVNGTLISPPPQTPRKKKGTVTPVGLDDVGRDSLPSVVYSLFLFPKFSASGRTSVFRGRKTGSRWQGHLREDDHQPLLRHIDTVLRRWCRGNPGWIPPPLRNNFASEILLHVSGLPKLG